MDNFSLIRWYSTMGLFHWLAINYFSYHIQHLVRILHLEPYQEGRTNFHSRLVLFTTLLHEGPNLNNYLFCCDNHLWPYVRCLLSPSCSSHHFENRLQFHLPPYAISHLTPCSSSRTGTISVRQDRYSVLHGTLITLAGSSSLAPTLITSSDQLNTVLGFIDSTSPDTSKTHSRSLVLPWGPSPGPIQLKTPWVSGTYEIHLSGDAELLCRLFLTSQYSGSNLPRRSLTNLE